jgi:quinol monooxygenase YgiN
MLIVSGEVRVEEGAIDGVRAALCTMEEETRKEPGCITYAFSLDISSPATMRIFERWESMDALRAHFATPHMAAFGKAIAQVRPKSMEVKVFEVAGEVALPR